MRELALVVAMNQERVIGVDGGLPWHFSEDLKHFRRITTGHCIIMGRKTWDSLPRALPHRKNIVITRNTELVAQGAVVVSSLEDALVLAQEDVCPMIIGGATIYDLALPHATIIYLTNVDTKVQGDTFFPVLGAEWTEISRRKGENPALTFIELRRIED